MRLKSFLEKGVDLLRRGVLKEWFTHGTVESAALRPTNAHENEHIKNWPQHKEEKDFAIKYL